MLVPRLMENVFCQRTENLIRIVHFSNEESFFEVDGIAARIVEAIDGKKSVLDIFEIVKVKSAVPSTHFLRLETDVTNFFQDLETRGLVTLK